MVSGWVGKLVVRRIQKKGIDLSRISFIPEPTKVPLQRNVMDPVPRIAEIRATEPMHKLDLPFNFRAFLVTGYEESRRILTDRDSYSNDIRHMFHGDGPATSDDIGGLGFTDPPLHTRLRKIVTPEFTMRRLARLEPMISEIVDRQLDNLAAEGSGADMAKHVAFPVPFQTICALLGLDYDDRDAFEKLGSARFDATNGGAAAFGAVSEQREFLFEAVAKQRKEPGPGLIGQILRDEGDLISDIDLAGLADGVFTGGFETTAAQIGKSIYCMLIHPDELQKVRNDPALVPAAVEELVRFIPLSSGTSMAWVATDDVELAGVTVRAGETVMASAATGSRDASVFIDPDRFDVTREQIPHLGFGHGTHFCLGAHLARMEMQVVISTLFTRFPYLRPAFAEDAVPWKVGSSVWGLAELPVTF